MSKQQYLWAVEDHVCRACFGRVLSRESIAGKRVYRCACCGIEREGHGPSALCACGIKLRQGHGPMDGGIRCLVNKQRTPENLAEVVAMQVSAPKAEPAAQRAARRDAVQAEQDGLWEDPAA